MPTGLTFLSLIFKRVPAPWSSLAGLCHGLCPAVRPDLVHSRRGERRVKLKGELRIACACKKTKSIEPTGFIVADKKLYLTNNNGNLITVDLVTGSIMNVIKIGRDIILQPQIHDKNLYLIKNGNIISYD